MAAEKASKSSETASSGMKPETQALISWIIAPIGGLIWMNESNALVRFHAKQSLYFGLASIVMWVVLTVVPVIGWCLLPVWGLVDLGVRIYMAVQANKGAMTKLPVIGDMAEKK